MYRPRIIHDNRTQIRLYLFFVNCKVLEIIRPAFLPGILFLGHLLDNLISRYAIWRIGASTVKSAKYGTSTGILHQRGLFREGYYKNPLHKRGRTASCPTAPSQIPACSIPAPGSSELVASAQHLLFPTVRFARFVPAFRIRIVFPLWATQLRRPLPHVVGSPASEDYGAI